MSNFTHKDLDGVWARLLPGGILEMRDPNDGQSCDPASKHRYQYRVAGGTEPRRRLPAESVGDCWRSEDAPPPWEPMELPRWRSLLTDFLRHALTS